MLTFRAPRLRGSAPARAAPRARRARDGRGEIAYDPWHYVPILERKPGALRNGAPFKGRKLPDALGRQRQPEPPATIPTPEGLQLRHQPVADCQRDDSLM